VLWQLLLPGTGLDVHLAHAPDDVMAAVYFGVPLLVLPALGALPRRVRPRRDRPAT
jgi:hypothetical protein